jgi:hypothetical protein
MPASISARGSQRASEDFTATAIGCRRLSRGERYLAVLSESRGIKVRQRDTEQPHTTRRRELRLKKIEGELLDHRP